jgi:predicted kinase
MNGKKPTVHMLCGIVGSGKTTLARRLALETKGVYFSLDEWMLTLYKQPMSREEFDDRLDRCCGMIWSVAKQVLSANIDVILDFGFWKREQRLQFRKLTETASVLHNLYYMRCSPTVAQTRVRERNKDLPAAHFEITDEMFETFLPKFEPPTAEEGLNMIIIDGNS